MKTYIAITIGPIYKTFHEAQKTRAVWAASYFFSWLVRRILEEAVEREIEAFLPYTFDDKGKFESQKGIYGAGLYADRLYFIGDDEIKQILEEIYANALKEICLKEESLTEDFLKKYINMRFVTHVSIDEKENVLNVINSKLDQAELYKNYNHLYNENPLQDFFAKRTNANNFLAADAFNDNNRKFRSLSEITTTDLFRKNKAKYNEILHTTLRDKNEDTDLIDSIGEDVFFKKQIRPFHKYYAVLYADGDNIGTMLKEINARNMGKASPEVSLQSFSKQLFDFGKLGEELIADYGGNGIYLGGEDVLAFLPAACVLNDGSKSCTFFDLIDKLDNAFKITVQAFAQTHKLPIPTMSYGIMLSYFKHPLKESMDEAHKLLDNVAKKVNNKNAIALKFRKHSGQYMECVLLKDKASTKAIYELIDKYSSIDLSTIDAAKDEKEFGILSGVIQRFKDVIFQKLYIEAIERNNLSHFFKNFFNEKPHGRLEGFLDEMQKISIDLYKDYKDEKVELESNAMILRSSDQDSNSEPLEIRNGQKLMMDILYTTLRFIHFLNSKRD